MSLYAIGDLHLSFSADKPMNIFGDKWENHAEKLKEGFSVLNDGDTCVLCGDLSWAMSLEGALEDFRFIDSLPGKKIVIKGNHDYWWSTAAKINAFFRENGISTVSLMHNSSFECDGVSLCGTRGWFYEEEKDTAHDEKIMLREIGRLRRSLEAAQCEEKLVFLHYPPAYLNYRCDEIFALLKEFSVKTCYYGHIHGAGCRSAFNGWTGGLELRLVSADSLNFKPLKIR